MTTENETSKTGPGENTDLGCKVDWSWLEGRTISAVSSDLQNLSISFEDGLSFKVQALNYKGQPFLSFNPHRNPNLEKKP